MKKSKVAMRVYLGIILALSFTLDGLAQNASEFRIQEEKNNPENLWVEEISGNEEEARERARQKLVELVHQQYEGALQSGGGTDPGNRLRQQNLQLNYQALVKEERRRSTVFLYINKAEAKNYVQRYATLPYRTDRYIYGEATAPSREEAINMAQQDLITQMIVQVFSEQESVVEESDFETSDEYRSQARAVSQMRLINANREVFPLEDEYYAMVYMTIEDKDESFNLIRNQAISFADEGERFRELELHSMAMKNYYRAYLLASNYNKSIEYSLEGKPVNNLRDELRLKVENYLYSMNIEMTPAYEYAARTLEIPFEAEYQGEPVDGVAYSQSITGSAETKNVRYGKGKIQIVNYFPENRTEITPVSFWIDITDITGSDEMIGALEEVHKIEVTRNLPVDFGNVLQPKIRAYIEGATVYFSIHNPFLNARTAAWDFGDGETGRGLSVEHEYFTQDEYKVEVVVNNDRELADTKYVNMQTAIVHNRPSMMRDNPELASMSENLASAKRNQDTAGTAGVNRQNSNGTESRTESENQDEPEPRGSSEPINRSPEDPETSILLTASGAVQAPESREARIAIREEIYAELTGYETFRSLVQKIDFMQKRNLIEYGNQDDFHNLEGALVIVADPSRVHEYLHFRNNRFMKVDTGEEVIDLSEEYEGKYLIWIQINEEHLF
ncbi:MAG: PKD domain-containing protein [Balneolaceae bacterium]